MVTTGPAGFVGGGADPTSGRVLSGIPGLDVDPFAIEFFENPYPAKEALREAGPVVHLDKGNVYGVARYAEVSAVLNDPLTFCSSRGVGLTDFAKEKPWRPPSLVLEADPPAHRRTRAVLNRALSPAVMKQIRYTFAAAAEAKVDQLLAKGRFDAVADLAEAYPLSVFPDAVGLKQEGREHLLPYAGVVFNAFGPPNELREAAIERSQPHQAYVQEQCQRNNLAPGGFGACIHARVDAGEITAAEAPTLVRSLLSAGSDTTVNGIGAAIYCLADEVERFGRAILVPVQSIVGDRGPLDPPDTESVFPEASQIWRNPLFAGLVETAARREAEENGPPWGAEESVFAEVGASSRISPDRKRPPALSRHAGPRKMGKCLGRRGSPALDPRARSMRPAARVTALILLRHMYPLLRFPRIDVLTSSATPRSR